MVVRIACGGCIMITAKSHHTPQHDVAGHAFSLVEMLVVIAIISVLAALLLPTVEGAVAAGNRIACANTMRQLGAGNAIYLGECNEWLPTILEAGNGYNLATASPLVSSGGYTSPYWLSLWPRPLRNCPTIPDLGMAAGWGPKQSDTELYYGYDLPQVSAAIASKFMYPRGANVFAPGATYNPGGPCEFIRLVPKFAYYPPNETATLFTGWGGQPFDLLGALPLCSDMSYTGAARGIVAHGPVTGKRDGDMSWAIPDGGNNLWLDGHVEWHERGPGAFITGVGTRLSNPGISLYRDAGWVSGVMAEDFRAAWYKPARRQ